MFLLCGVYLWLLWPICNADGALEGNESSTINYYGPSPYDIEDYCENESEGKVIYIEPWRAAIFQVGYKFRNDGIPFSRKIHKCKVIVKTAPNFWLVAAIEHMKMRGSRDSSNKWECSDYLQFSSPGRNLISKILSVFEIDINPKKSERLCGDKRLDGEKLDIIFDVSTDANSFSTANNEMHLVFRQDDDDKHLANNSFRVVVTTFRHASEQVECEGKQKCYGRDIFCIDKKFVCDGHVNCAFPGSGTDEKICKVDKKPNIFDTTSVIIIILTSIVSFGILICIISSIKNRINSEQRSNRRNQTVTSNSSYYSDTAHQMPIEAPLPPYESVILSDLIDGRKEGLDDLQPDEENETPPKYESLFPEESSAIQLEANSNNNNNNNNEDVPLAPPIQRNTTTNE